MSTGEDTVENQPQFTAIMQVGHVQLRTSDVC